VGKGKKYRESREVPETLRVGKGGAGRGPKRPVSNHQGTPRPTENLRDQGVNLGLERKRKRQDSRLVFRLVTGLNFVSSSWKEKVSTREDVLPARGESEKGGQWGKHFNRSIPYPTEKRVKKWRKGYPGQEGAEGGAWWGSPF